MKHIRWNLVSVVIWIMILLAFIVGFVFYDSDEKWIELVGVRLAYNVLAGIGILFYIIGLFIHKKRQVDERTNRILRKSSTTTLTAVMIYVFLISLSLYDLHQSTGTITVSWLWFIGYTTVFMTLIINSVFYYYFDKTDDFYED